MNSEGLESLDEALAPYDFALPPEQIAQTPPAERDGARMMVLARDRAAPRHSQIRGLPDWLEAGDLLVVNATQVLAARLRGRKGSGGAVEALLLGPIADDPHSFRALVKQSSGRLREGTKFEFASSAPGHEGEPPLCAEITAIGERGEVTLRFDDARSPYALGEMPLPPYIERTSAPASEKEADRTRYQTVFARVPGAVAAPTAGLHLSEALLAALQSKGIEIAEVILHVGAGTFRPLDSEALTSGRLHEERFELSARTARAIAATRERGGRVVAVGTTTTRVLESCAAPGGLVESRTGSTELFLRPGDEFQVVDALLTNFHLPRSSLLMLVSAFAGRERVMAAYREAVDEHYRFFSYGDAMLLFRSDA